MHTGPRVTWGPNGSSPADSDEPGRAAAGYLIWPYALLELIRADPGATLWYREHLRQATVYGVLGTVAFACLMAAPFVVTLGLALGSGATIFVYSLGMAADAAVGLGAIAYTLWCAARASRGERFDIPVAGQLARARR